MDWKTLSSWRELVKLYSKCDLTYTSDKLPAFADLARAYQEIIGDVYLAALWRSHLLHRLDWRSILPVTESHSSAAHLLGRGLP
jgi:hypothetical protein